MTYRPIAHVLRPPRLPIWPVAAGATAWLTQAVGLTSAADAIERRWGGRVTPTQLPVPACDPFLLVVHHRHTFSACDPVRPLSRLVMPEGFPAHPHRGFQTVTWVLSGALRHRDSAGVKMTYGDGAAQWLSAGDGVLHEEMWAPQPGVPQELYQIWVNLPAAEKRTPARLHLLGDGMISHGEGVSQSPISQADVGDVEVQLLAGRCGGLAAPAPFGPDVTIARLRWRAPATFTWAELPAHHNAMVFVRRGAVTVAGQPLEPFRVGILQRDGSVGVQLEGTAGAEVLLLSGAPLREPVAMGGAMVMNNQADVDEAWRDYQRGAFGAPWDHRASDEAWLAALRAGGA